MFECCHFNYYKYGNIRLYFDMSCFLTGLSEFLGRPVLFIAGIFNAAGNESVRRKPAVSKNQKNVEKTKNLYFGIDFYVSMCYNPFVKETIRFMASGVKLFIQKIKDSWIWLVSFSVICLTIQESIQKNSTLRLTF